MKLGKRFFVVLYSITIVIFFLYISIFSDNNFARHRELNRQIENLELKIAKTKNQINNTHTFEKLMADKMLLEHYAREQMDLHKKGEDVFIIVYE